MYQRAGEIERDRCRAETIDRVCKTLLGSCQIDKPFVAIHPKQRLVPPSLSLDLLYWAESRSAPTVVSDKPCLRRRTVGHLTALGSGSGCRSGDVGSSGCPSGGNPTRRTRGDPGTRHTLFLLRVHPWHHTYRFRQPDISVRGERSCLHRAGSESGTQRGSVTGLRETAATEIIEASG